jgi:hypothetical protein
MACSFCSSKRLVRRDVILCNSCFYLNNFIQPSVQDMKYFHNRSFKWLNDSHTHSGEVLLNIVFVWTDFICQYTVMEQEINFHILVCLSVSNWPYTHWFQVTTGSIYSVFEVEWSAWGSVRFCTGKNSAVPPSSRTMWSQHVCEKSVPAPGIEPCYIDRNFFYPFLISRKISEDPHLDKVNFSPLLSWDILWHVVGSLLAVGIGEMM